MDSSQKFYMSVFMFMRNQFEKVKNVVEGWNERWQGRFALLTCDEKKNIAVVVLQGHDIVVRYKQVEES